MLPASCFLWKGPYLALAPPVQKRRGPTANRRSFPPVSVGTGKESPPTPRGHFVVVVERVRFDSIRLTNPRPRGKTAADRAKSSGLEVSAEEDGRTSPPPPPFRISTPARENDSEPRKRSGLEVSAEEDGRTSLLPAFPRQRGNWQCFALSPFRCCFSLAAFVLFLATREAPNK